LAGTAAGDLALVSDVFEVKAQLVGVPFRTFEDCGTHEPGKCPLSPSKMSKSPVSDIHCLQVEILESIKFDIKWYSKILKDFRQLLVD
jgi:hypothetical protein